MADLAASFGRRVRELRTSGGMTQPQLAEAIDMSVEWVRRIENGGASPSFDTISALATALGVRPGDLFTEERVPSAVRVAMAADGLTDAEIAWLLEGARLLHASAHSHREGRGAASRGNRQSTRTGRTKRRG